MSCQVKFELKIEALILLETRVGDWVTIDIGIDSKRGHHTP